jgi:hypothetical protein
MRGVKITKVHEGGRAVSVDSLIPRPMTDEFVRNFQISRMIQDVKAGPAWMTDFDWCLRYTDDESDPFCVTDHAVSVIGSQPITELSLGNL